MCFVHLHTFKSCHCLVITEKKEILKLDSEKILSHLLLNQIVSLVISMWSYMYVQISN